MLHKDVKRSWFLMIALFALIVGLVACGGSADTEDEPEADAPAAEETDSEDEAMDEEEPAAAGLESDAAEVKSEFFSQEQYDRAMRQMTLTAEGPADQPWLQMLEPEMVDTSEWAKEGPYTFCFSNAGVNNPWRVVGYTTMQAEVDLHPEIEEFIHVDAEGSDEKQISDIADLVASGNCDVLIVSPNTTAALTPAVEQACEELPVIVFDRGVFTECPVSFVQPIGGYAFGETGARYIIDNCGDDCNVLALRILPGVDVLEERWAAAKLAFEGSDVNVIGVEFGDGDNAKVNSIVTDYLDRFGRIDAVWMDAGATAVAALEAFEDAGQPYPIIVGEDQQDFLVKWQENDLSGISPTFPTFQWRTPVIAGLQIMNGEEVPAVWRLPQPTITNDNLDQYVQDNMPPLHYAMCGCEEMPDFPGRWGGE
ncbi:substrate-binding domain-containing protein [Candidatus Leptofilum sp.]|uniref:substrate-binding domain-containing protein n=1 Tax=Candidatus Leptofilum sp. TaxID=3241576 RepID=UPI003B5A74D1